MRLKSLTTVRWLGVAALVAMTGCDGCNNEPGVDAGTGVLPDAVLPDAGPPVEAQLTITPPLADFGDVVVGQTSAATTFTVENEGTGPSAALSATFGGSGASDFRFDSNGCAGMRLDPGETCTISVEFRPGDVGGSSATLTVTGGDATATATLEGNGARDAGLAITPTPFNYGDVVIGTPSAPNEFTVRNTGEAESGTLDITLSGLDGSQFELGTDACSGTTLDVGASCTVEVIYNPSTSGVHMGSLQATADPGATATAALQGRAASAADLRLLPGSQDFGSVVTGTPSSNVTFTLTNTGGVASGTISHTFTGADAAEFSVVSSTCAGAPLDGGDSCDIVVRFNPATAGAKVASLDVTDSAITVSADLTANGVTPGSIIFEPPTRYFGTSAVGVATGATTFTLRNTGGSATTAITVAVAGTNPADFPIVAGGDGCSGAILPALGTCTVAVQFNPTASGSRAATLRAQTAAGTPATSALTGDGEVAAAIEITPTAADFGSVAIGASSSNVSFTVRNTGGSPTTIPTVSLTGVQSTQWSIVSNGCTASIPGGGTCDIVLRFNPTGAAGGTRTAVLNVSATTGGSDTADLSGIGITPANLSLLPTAVAFGQVAETRTGVQSVVVSNSGAEAIGGLSAVVTGTGFSLLGSTTCTATLAGGGTCRLDIQYAPAQGAALGADPGTDVTGNLSVTGTPAGSPVINLTAGLSATAIPDLRITAQGGDPFASVIIGEAATREYVITNNTGASVTGFTVASPTGAMEWTRVAASTDDCAGLATANTLTASGGDQACRIAIRLIPTGTPGARSISLTVNGMGAAALTETLAIAGNARGALRWTGWATSFDGAASVCTGAGCTFGTTFPAAFGNRPIGQFYEITLRATNERPATATTQITTTPAFTGDMNIVNDGCSGQTVPGAGNCYVVVRYYPQTTGTSASGNVALLTGTGPTLQTTPNPTTPMITGAAIIGATINTPATATFGNVVATQTADQTITVSNPGAVATGNLSITAPTGRFSLNGGTCVAGMPIAATSSCTIIVRYSPLIGDATNVDTTGTLNLSVPGTARVVNLSGRALSYLELTPAAPATIVTPSGVASSATSFTVRNLGSVTTGLIVVSVAGTGAGDFTVQNNLCSSVPVGGTCTFEVVYGPTTVDRPGMEVRVSSGAFVANTARVDTATLAGDVQNPAALSVSPVTGTTTFPGTPSNTGRLMFGRTLEGANSDSFVFTFTNNGQLPTTSALSAVIDTDTLPGGTSDFDILANTCTAVLAAGASCTVTVRFSPPAGTGGVGGGLNRFGRLTVSAGAASAVAFLRGSSVNGVSIQGTPSPIAFGPLAGGATSAPVTLTVSNSGATDVTITSMCVDQLGGACPGTTRFTVIPGTGPTGCFVGQTIVAGGVCTYTATYNPPAGGPFGFDQVEFLVNVSSGAGTRQAANGIALTPAALSVTPAGPSVSIPSSGGATAAGSVSTRTFTVTNTGQVATTATPTLALSGADPGQFAIPSGASNTCTAPLAGGASCTFEAEFRPTLGGARTATLTVTAGALSAVRTLTGNGAAAALLGITPSAPQLCASPTRAAGTGALDFGVCTTFTVSNSGGSPTATPLSIGVTGDFLIQDSSTCVGGAATTRGDATRTGIVLSEVVGSNTCTVIVQHAPTSVGDDSGTLTVSATGTSATGTVSAAGISALQLTAGSPAFGSTGTGAGGGVTRTFTFTNLTDPATGTLSYTITGTHFDVVSDGCSGITRGRSATCQVSVRFVPTTAGAYSETLTVSDGTAEKRAVVTLTGTGT